jgi:hypothetical protein
MAILKKIKECFKKIARKSGIKGISPKPREAVSPEQPKEGLGMQEMMVEKAKYYTPQISRPTPIRIEELPLGYGENKIVLQVRDPWWLHAYWEVTAQTFDRLREKLGNVSAKTVLRVYDVSHIIFDGKNAHRFFDLEISPQANNWYIDVGGPGRSWIVDLGLRLANGEFIKIVRSNPVSTPLDGPSWITDEEWMIPEDMFARLYGMGFGFGRSSPVGKAWQERIKRELFSGVLASPGISSLASPVKKAAVEKKFWLLVNTELIVYGATEPNAKLSVQGSPIKLRPDGTFSLRFSLPDGRQVIPVQARSFDGAEERTITPTVTKETK